MDKITEIYLIGDNKGYNITQLSWLLEERKNVVSTFKNLEIAIKHIEDNKVKTNIVFVILSTIDIYMLNKIVNNNKYGFVFTIGGHHTDYVLNSINKVKIEIQLRSENSVENAIKEWITIEKRNIESGYQEDNFLMMKGKQKFTLTDMLNAIQNKTEDGYEIVNSVIMLAIDLVLRGKREIK